MKLPGEGYVDKKIIKGKAVRNITVAAVCVLLGIIIAFEYKAIKNTNTGSEKNDDTIENYQATIIEMGNNIDALRQEKAELEKKVSTFENSTNDERIAALEAQVENLRVLAGLTAADGEGIIITLSYSSPGDIARSSSLFLTLINELKASDAQAIAINGERLHAMSEVRAVNDYLVVNGKACYTPLTISVVGDAKNLTSAIEMSGVKTQFDNYFNLSGGQFLMEYSQNVNVSALSEEYLKSITDKLRETGN